MPIMRLPENLANQIAAGEVVERPASILKELTENALDAGATQVKISLVRSGLTSLQVTDNGHGIAKDELKLALERHATSKIATTEDLFRITTFGFRGEALPSIASVARLTLTSLPRGQAEAWQVLPHGTLQPAAHPQGTTVLVEDLFYATPARRKFLKSERAEQLAIEAVIKNLALAHPQLTLTVVEDGVETWHFPAAQGDFFNATTPRLQQVLGVEFARQVLQVQAAKTMPEMAIQGFISSATLHSGTSARQYIFINQRPVKERALHTALRNAYGDALPAGRHPQAVLFITLPPDALDVNVHPAKTEVRFQQPQEVYSLIFSAVRQTLGQVKVPAAMQVAMQQVPAQHHAYSLYFQAPPQKLVKGEELHSHSVELGSPEAFAVPSLEHDVAPSLSLGAALGQVANTYIVSETAEGSLVITDQHAAHERLVYEKLKEQFGQGRILSQPLLLPVVVALTPATTSLLLAHAAELQTFGLEIEPHSPTSLAVTATPQLLGAFNPTPLIHELAEDLQTLPNRTMLQQKLHHVLATIACHHSVRAGRRLSVHEQNALLRQMEHTPSSLTCNHGRPTTMTLTREELEKRFARR